MRDNITAQTNFMELCCGHDFGAYGLCTRPKKHTGLHRDAMGHEFAGHDSRVRVADDTSEKHLVHLRDGDKSISNCQLWMTACLCGWDSGEWTTEAGALKIGLEHLNAILTYEVQS